MNLCSKTQPMAIEKYFLNKTDKLEIKEALFVVSGIPQPPLPTVYGKFAFITLELKSS